MKSCECGCGTLVNSRFVSGHNSRGKTNPMYGKKHKKQVIKKMSRNRRGLTAGVENPAYKHGHYLGRKSSCTMRSYEAMKTRCNNSNHQYYYLYGGRGIVVCKRWMESFENFLEDMGERPKGKTIDRINPDGNYKPSNCRWATPREQRLNRRK